MVEDKILPFNERRECPKCGIGRYATNMETLFKEKYIEPQIYMYCEDVEEHLEVKCHNCGYSWKERCMDYGEKANG